MRTAPEIVRFEWENKHSKVGIYQIVCGVRSEALTSQTRSTEVPGNVKSFIISKQVHYGMQQQHYDHQHHQQKDKDEDESEDDESEEDDDGEDADNEEDGNGMDDAESDAENDSGGELNAWRGKIVNPEVIDIQALFAGETMGSYGDDSDSSEDEDLVDRMSRGTAGGSRKETITRAQTDIPNKRGRGIRTDFHQLVHGSSAKKSKKK